MAFRAMPAVQSGRQGQSGLRTRSRILRTTSTLVLLIGVLLDDAVTQTVGGEVAVGDFRDRMGRRTALVVETHHVALASGLIMLRPILICSMP